MVKRCENDAQERDYELKLRFERFVIAVTLSSVICHLILIIQCFCLMKGLQLGSQIESGIKLLYVLNSTYNLFLYLYFFEKMRRSFLSSISCWTGGHSEPNTI